MKKINVSVKKEMPDDINELDVNDIGLKGIFGSRFQDATQPASEQEEVTFAPEMEVRWSEPKKPVSIGKLPKMEKSFTQKLMACGKKSAVYAGLCILIAYWQSTGMMDASAAMPCMMTCTALIGVTYGRIFVKEMF